MDINDKAINAIIKGIIDALKKYESLPHTSVFQSVICKVNTDGTYQIVRNKHNYNVKNGLGTELGIGQNVWVMIPNGSIRDMFVCGVR